MSERARLICPPCAGWRTTVQESRHLSPPMNWIITTVTTCRRLPGIADASMMDCRACMAAARFELIHGRRDAARAYVQRARTHHRQAIAIRWRMRSWP